MGCTENMAKTNIETVDKFRSAISVRSMDRAATLHIWPTASNCLTASGGSGSDAEPRVRVDERMERCGLARFDAARQEAPASACRRVTPLRETARFVARG